MLAQVLFTMVKNTERQKLIRTMAQIARTCGVEAVHDSTGRSKVKEMMENIRASTCSPEDKASAETAWTAYEATFETGGVADAPQEQAQHQANEPEPSQTTRGFRLRGRSFLFTYNWNFLGKALPDGTPPPATADEVWHMWLAWKATCEQEQRVKKSTSTLEESLASNTERRLHLLHATS